MTNESGAKGLWQKFRSLPTKVQAASWIGLAALVIAVGVAGGEDGSSRTAVETATSPTPIVTTPAPTYTTATPSPTPTKTTPAPSPTPTISLAEWRAEHDGSITIVISTAYGLAQALDGNSETRIKASCDALTNNIRTYLVPIPTPPGSFGEDFGKWEQALNEIHTASRYCENGFLGLRQADFYKARTSAIAGISLLHEVVGTEK